MSSLKGLHWGKVELEEKNLSFVVNDKGTSKNLFKIPLKKINNSTINKNDIIIQLNTDDINNQQDMLCEVRFFVDNIKSEQPMKQQEENQSVNFVEALNNQIIEKAKIGELAGQSIATLNQISMAVPRGKYTIDFYQKNLRFHGSTFNYNVDYKNIQRGFILPLTNQAQTAIVLQLLKPIHQGQTIHPYIVIQIKKQFQLTVKTKVKPQYLKQSPNLQKIKPEYEGQLEDILADLLRAIVGIDLIVPGEHFKSHQGTPCVKCSFKTQTGWLYFLKKSMIFITKPVIYFKIPDIEKVQFHRIGLSNKQFDVKIILKNGQNTLFMSIQRVQLDIIMDYMKQREVPVIKVGEIDKKIRLEEDDQESEQDQDFHAEEVAESDDDDESVQESISKSKSK